MTLLSFCPLYNCLGLQTLVGSSGLTWESCGRLMTSFRPIHKILTGSVGLQDIRPENTMLSRFLISHDCYTERWPHCNMVALSLSLGTQKQSG